MASASGRTAAAREEVAKAWCAADGTIRVPADLQALLDSNPALGSVRVGTVIPELPTPLGDVPRGARRHDLVLLGLDAQGRETLVGVEAKADEPFDAPVSTRVVQARRAVDTAAADDRAHLSAQIPRIERFCRTLIGREAFLPDGMIDPVVAALPYQLLAGVAGTLIEAGVRGATLAAFVVHAFYSNALKAERVAANDAGFAAFVHALPGGGALDVSYGRLCGPLHLPGGEGIPALPLFVGIAGTQLGE